MKICLLITTCDKYLWIARFTNFQINRYWLDHPPVFFCGSRPEDMDDPGQWLPLLDKQEDWMAILQKACRDLINRDYTHTYLILDDHPPIFKCHEGHLNRTIPELMVNLGASYIGLNGHGQGRPTTGNLLSQKQFYLENVSKDYLWKFQLHPAIWDLHFLGNLLDLFIIKLPNEYHTPWAFEKRAGDPQAPIPEHWKHSSYRISGLKMTRNIWRVYALAIIIFSFKVIRFLSGKIVGQKAWTYLDNNFSFITRYYDGPYPIYWEGVLRKGRLNNYLIQFLKFSKQKMTLKTLYKFYEGKV